MTVDFSKILSSKSAYRRSLAGRDIVEKLQMLDALCERALVLQKNSHTRNFKPRLTVPTPDEVEGKFKKS